MVATYIALATFNGEQFIAEQIESIQAQSVPNWRLLVRDDGSTDRTLEIVEMYGATDERIQILPSGVSVGTIGNFSRLFHAARTEGADYVFPCDQDDVWLPDKMERMMDEIVYLEGETSKTTPLLVHSDLEVVDEALERIDSSFMHYRRLRHEDNALGVLLVHNFVTGCASVYNRALLEASLPVPDGCVMHDWWIALVAAATGRIGFLKESLVQYRQHGANQIGAERVSTAPSARKLPRHQRAELADKNTLDSIRQAALLNERLAESYLAGTGARAAVADYATILEKSSWVRAARLLRHGILPQRIRARHWSVLRTAMLHDSGEVGVAADGGITVALGPDADG